MVNVYVGQYLVDALFAEEKLIVELDSWEFHGSRAAFESDRERHADTLETGHGTVRVTRRRMRGNPEAEGTRLQRILAACRRRRAA